MIYNLYLILCHHLLHHHHRHHHLFRLLTLCGKIVSNCVVNFLVAIHGYCDFKVRKCLLSVHKNLYINIFLFLLIPS